MAATEKDARFLFCPLLTTPDGKMRFCQGSQCMMWRWSGDEQGEAAPGFCGLASAPVAASRPVRAAGMLAPAPKKEPDNPFG
jgi:hypothetical protein